MKKITTIAMLVFASLYSNGQNTYSAQVKNLQNFESIGSAYVQIKDKKITTPPMLLQMAQ